MPNLKFDGKAGTLECLAGRLSSAIVLPQFVVTQHEWLSRRAEVLAAVQSWARRLDIDQLIVRSSAHCEDVDTASRAGEFLSVGSLSVEDFPALSRAIEQVVQSMPADSRNRFFFQPMLVDVALAGVAFGVEPNSGAPYHVISFDDTSGQTDRITAGRSNHITTAFHHHSKPTGNELHAPVVRMLRELQSLFGTARIDAEFAVLRDETLVLLQARPLLAPEPEFSEAEHAACVNRISEKIGASQGHHPFLFGHKTVFGIMPDWNPAEIIGTRPRPLALSLYRNLVTDSIWAYQRNNYGYRDLRSFPLLQHFFGQPYIDVRVSFNSFIPRDIDAALGHKLVDYYVDRLLKFPALHDKVEFEILFSCYTLDLEERLKPLLELGFSAEELARLKDELRKLTNRVIHPTNGLWRSDQRRLGTLESRRAELLASSLDPVSKIYWLLEDCKRYGTLPFAGLARAGFIAMQLLDSLVATGVLSDIERDGFLLGLTTVSSQFSEDLQTLDGDRLLERYGHLRPGTYDILTPRYDEDPAYLVPRAPVVTKGAEPKAFSLSLAQLRDIAALLSQHGFEHDVVGLFGFIEAGITLREHAKFAFTRNLSDAMRAFQAYGRGLGFSDDDLSYADCACVAELYSGAVHPAELIARSVEQGRQRYKFTRSLALPALICEPDDVWVFKHSECEPNFVTLKSVVAPVVGPDTHHSLANCIVAIESADPGFDWIFAHGIAGLVTKYGGCNSHMAIRACEFGIPAVIGAGERLFDMCQRSQRLLLDCASKRIERVA